jgi:hypothetical protein
VRTTSFAKDILNCKNRCFVEISHNSIQKEGYVFGKKFQCDFRQSHSLQKYLNDVYAEIAYWREDDRYLAKILGGN